MQAQQLSIRRRRTHQFQLWIDRVADEARKLRERCYVVFHDVPLSKFGQFFFLADHFYMDLPNTHVDWDTAQRIVRERSGFFWFSERAEHCRYYTVDSLVDFDQLGKHYNCGDSSAAAQDLAYLFFDIWQFPVNERFRVLAWSIDEKFSWREFIV